MPPVFDYQKCNGCGICELYCPGDVIYMEGGDKDSRRPVLKYPEECWHCGICRLDCRRGAVSYKFPLLMT